ncbi:cyclin-D2-1-like isoform X1 [Carex littledalei]|uniref:Cyclin-D2-1-like isoform X1 n=1 Tax=Carex littledalei TaxID=544730 RepID=A0A833VRF5_9POAL|nr:cyclin-D2-1-like isoform X1 [Carex littledalei]
MPQGLKDLLCSEDAESLESDSGLNRCFTNVSFSEDDKEVLARLIETESNHSTRSDYVSRLRSHSFDLFSRADSVSWVLKARARHLFLPVTAYLAVNYMDRFFSLHRLLEEKDWGMQLLAVTCLSLAMKMEETFIPSLLDLQADSGEFVFEAKTIQRLELLVLAALDWRLRSVTPFEFIEFFAYKADPSGKYGRYLVSRATKIILSTLHDIDFLDHRASSLAAAAIICASDEIQDLAFTNIDTAVVWCSGLTHDGVGSCYQLMKQIAVNNNVERKQPVILSQQRVMPGVRVEFASLSSSPPSRRRKREERDPMFT